MIMLISIVLITLFMALSGLHFYWGLGGRWSWGATIPSAEDNTPIIHPSWRSSFVVGSGLLTFGILVLVKAGLVNFELPVWLSSYGLWMVAVIFIMRAIGEFRYVGFFKRVKKTTFGEMDTKYYSPLCLMIGILTIILQMET